MKSSFFFSIKSLISNPLILIFWITFLPAYSQKDQTNQLIISLDKTIPQLLDSANIPGLSLAVIRDGKIIYAQAYGVKNIKTKERVNINTTFEAASLSKPVFAFACLKFVEEGLLDLDKPLYQYLPYKDIESDLRYKKITARMVLSHSSGFPNWRNNGSLRINFEPGQRFSYSGEGYVYLQKVLEKITGKDLNEIMIDKVFNPLGMNRSSYIWKKSFDNNYAIPHDNFSHTRKKFEQSKSNAAFSLHTTAQDYATFIVAIINEIGLKKQTIDTMLTPQVLMGEKTSELSSPISSLLSWGLGFGLQDTQDGRYFWHWGDIGNSKCYVAACKNKKDGVVYFTNSYNGLSISRAILQSTIGGEQPAIDALGYEDYNSPSYLFKRNIYSVGIKNAIEPFLDTSKRSIFKEEVRNEIGYYLLSIKRMDLAKEVFEINVRSYPNSFNVYDSYAEALLKNGEYDAAAKNYLKSFQLNPENKKAEYISSQLTNPIAIKGNTELKLKGHKKAKLVTLAGSFNNWDNIHTFFFRKGNEWVCNFDLAPGTYQYKIVIDGKWILDPGNPDIIKDNGSTNSLLIVK